jgi:hypothetical protein
MLWIPYLFGKFYWVRSFNHIEIDNSFKWVCDYCLMPYKQFFSYIMARTIYILMRRDDDDIRFVLDQLGWIFIVLAHWNNSQRVDM